MTHTYSAGGSRQPAVFAAIIALHLGIYFAIVSGPGIRLPGADKEVPPVRVLPEREPPPEVVAPAEPMRMEGLVVVVEQPDTRLPIFPDPAESTTTIDDPVSDSIKSGSGPSIPVFQPATRRTQDSLLAALIDACYPAASRRLGEEGRAVARLTIGAQSTVMSWQIAESSGFPRLDAAMDCVIKRLDFVAARRDGRAVATEVWLPIVFRLD